MSVPTYVPSQEKLNCDDSPLSITGNVIGILTFVVAVTVSMQVYLTSIRNASQNISVLSRQLESRITEIQPLQQLLVREYGDGVLEEILAPSVQRVGVFLAESESLLLRIHRGVDDKRGGVRTGVKFVYMEDNLKKCIEEADDVLGIVRGSATSALLHLVCTSTERIEEYLSQTSAQMEKMKSDIHQNTYLLEELQSMKRDTGTDDHMVQQKRN